MPDPMVKIHEEQFRSTNERLQFSLDAARSKFSSEDLKPFYARIQQTRNSGKSHHDQAIEINRICMDLFKFAENAPTPTNGFRTAMQEESDNRKRFIERYGSFAGFRTNTAPPPRTK